MKTVKLNIGLENNPYEFHEILHLLKVNKSARIEVGEYNGEPERTAVIETEFNDVEVEDIISSIKIGCQICTQECIAVKIDDVGYLVYNPNFEGEKFEFDNQYFIEP